VTATPQAALQRAISGRTLLLFVVGLRAEDDAS
jgi:hypothetical protein